MRPGDLVEMSDIGIKSGTIGLITGVNRHSKNFVTYDVILDGENVEGIDQHFVLPLCLSEIGEESRD